MRNGMEQSNYTLVDVLSKISVHEIGKKEVLTVSVGWSVRQLSQFFLKHGISGAPVVNAVNQLVGVVSQSDIVRFEINPPNTDVILNAVKEQMGPDATIDVNNVEQIKSHASEYCTVSLIMTKKVYSIDSKSSVYDAYQLIKVQDIHRLFITKDEKLEGVLTAMDILDVVMLQMGDVFVSV